MSRSYTSSPPSASMACRGTALLCFFFTFYLSINKTVSAVLYFFTGNILQAGKMKVTRKTVISYWNKEFTNIVLICHRGRCIKLVCFCTWLRKQVCKPYFEVSVSQ
jgi:hypothetical protein